MNKTWMEGSEFLTNGDPPWPEQITNLSEEVTVGRSEKKHKHLPRIKWAAWTQSRLVASGKLVDVQPSISKNCKSSVESRNLSMM